MPTLYTLDPTRENLVGHFSRDHAPILTVDPGDTVRCRTLDAGWGLEPYRGHDAPRRKFEPRGGDDDEGHCMIGPIAVRGAAPGSTLEIRIGTIRPGSYGYTSAGGWPHPVNERFGFTDSEVVHVWTLASIAVDLRITQIVNGVRGAHAFLPYGAIR